MRMARIILLSLLLPLLLPAAAAQDRVAEIDWSDPALEERRRAPLAASVLGGLDPLAVAKLQALHLPVLGLDGSRLSDLLRQGAVREPGVLAVPYDDRLGYTLNYLLGPEVYLRVSADRRVHEAPATLPSPAPLPGAGATAEEIFEARIQLSRFGIPYVVELHCLTEAVSDLCRDEGLVRALAGDLTVLLPGTPEAAR